MAGLCEDGNEPSGSLKVLSLPSYQSAGLRSKVDVCCSGAQVLSPSRYLLRYILNEIPVAWRNAVSYQDRSNTGVAQLEQILLLS
ncbi:hypothetical protein ANN_08650 [Periplaneta americana]|uniref:Uncharacterized protein n=1 Tax=Periplaneta americana TaxID=6978 RepID=A0ABQ8T373_PERAM|nr:hypothetical protein ANN_08650 [Periplaneta americana]